MVNTTMMTDDMDIDFTSFYQPAAENSKFEKKAVDETRTGQVLDCTNSHHLGTTLFCLVPDKVLTSATPKTPGAPRLYRKVQWGFDGSVLEAGSDKMHIQIQIPRPEDFLCSLSSSQRDCIDHLRTLGKSFVDLTSFKNKDLNPEVSRLIRISNPPQIIYTYGKLLRYCSLSEGEVKSPEIGHMRVLKFAKGQVGKNDFATMLNNRIQGKIATKGHTKWMKDYFNRTPGQKDKCLSVRVDQAAGAIRSYMLTVDFEEDIPFELTQEDLEVANNLNTRVFNIEAFDDEYYNKLTLAFDRVQEVVDQKSKAALSVSSTDDIDDYSAEELDI